VIESCGTLLRIADQQEYEFPRGLGVRHHAAAAVTVVTDSVAVTVSQSTGAVTVFRFDHTMTELDRPRDPGASSESPLSCSSRAAGCEGTAWDGQLHRQSGLDAFIVCGQYDQAKRHAADQPALDQENRFAELPLLFKAGLLSVPASHDVRDDR
jgi:hypothetical protein